MKIPEINLSNFTNDVKLNINATLMNMKSDTIFIKAAEKIYKLEIKPETQNKELLNENNIGKNLNFLIKVSETENTIEKVSLGRINSNETDIKVDTPQYKEKQGNFDLNINVKGSILNLENEIAIRELSLIKIFQKNEIEVNQTFRKEFTDLVKFFEETEFELKEKNLFVVKELVKNFEQLDLRNLKIFDNFDKVDLPESIEDLETVKKELEILFKEFSDKNGKLNQNKLSAYTSLLLKSEKAVNIKNLLELADFDKVVMKNNPKELGNIQKYLAKIFKPQNNLIEEISLNKLSDFIRQWTRKDGEKTTHGQENKYNMESDLKINKILKEYPNIINMAIADIKDTKMGDFEIFFAEKGSRYKNRITKYAYLKINTKNNGFVEAYCKLNDMNLDISFSSEEEAMLEKLIANQANLINIMKSIGLRSISVSKIPNKDKPTFLEYICEAGTNEGRLDIKI